MIVMVPNGDRDLEGARVRLKPGKGVLKGAQDLTGSLLGGGNWPRGVGALSRSLRCG